VVEQLLAPELMVERTVLEHLIPSFGFNLVYCENLKSEVNYLVGVCPFNWIMKIHLPKTSPAHGFHIELSRNIS
jgi:hypothetical protein